MAREVHTKCIRGALKAKTRVLVTNQLQFVSGSDRVLYMSDGQIAESGTYEELIKAEKGFAKLMKQAEVLNLHSKIIFHFLCRNEDKSCSGRVQYCKT